MIPQVPECLWLESVPLQSEQKIVGLCTSNTSKVPTDHSQFMGPSVCLNRRLHQPGKNFPTSKMDLYQHQYHPILIYSTENNI